MQRFVGLSIACKSCSRPSPSFLFFFLRARACKSVQGDAALLASFPADPPTTTMQRIKALLSGSLPTFLDVGSVFSGGLITEDNVVSQAMAAGKRVGAIGDDTWEQLFPSSLNLSQPFASFNVKDLHTVDAGVNAVRGIGCTAYAKKCHGTKRYVYAA